MIYLILFCNQLKSELDGFILKLTCSIRHNVGENTYIKGELMSQVGAISSTSYTHSVFNGSIKRKISASEFKKHCSLLKSVGQVEALEELLRLHYQNPVNSVDELIGDIESMLVEKGNYLYGTHLQKPMVLSVESIKRKVNNGVYAQ